MNKFKRTIGPPCACGCGEKVKWNKYENKWNRFVYHHHSKGQNNPMKKLEARKRSSISHIGNQHSEATKEKMSKSRKGRKVSKETREKLSLSNTGKIMSKETRKKLSNSLKGRKLSKEHILNISVSQIKCRTDGYCNAWGDEEFKKDCRKNYCEICGIELKWIICTDGIARPNLRLHHKDFNKKNCCPDNFLTLCSSCHIILHNEDRKRKNKQRRGQLSQAKV